MYVMAEIHSTTAHNTDRPALLCVQGVDYRSLIISFWSFNSTSLRIPTTCLFLIMLIMRETPLKPKVKSKMWEPVESIPAFVERLELAFVGFSGYSNFRRVWSYNQKDSHIPVLNGVRTLTLCWVILGYSWLFGPLYAESWVTCEYN